MPKLLPLFAALLLTVSTIPASHATSLTAPRKTLTAFASERELAEVMKGWADELKRQRDELARRRMDSAQGMSQLAPASPAPAEAAAKSKDESVTNVQHAGVDEGGIVKVHGDHLVILRRGRLFTVRVGDNDLRPVSYADAFGPDIDPRGAWYDEMLISGNNVVVIGYSYARGGSEIGLFDISRRGELTHKGTYHLRSNDYYSSRNYASRLIGTKLVFYTPLYLNLSSSNPYESFPAVRRWRPDATPSDFKRIAPATRIYRTDEPLDPHAGIALHSVSICDLAKRELECESTAVMAAPGRVFYVSPSSVFVWTTAWNRSTGSRPSAMFRIPLDGSAPSALKVAGSPIDQFSFLEGNDGMLNVLVRSNGRGDGMWLGENNAGNLALLRVALSSFSDGKDSAPSNAYSPLLKPDGYALQSRYVGSYLLYGAGTGWRRPAVTKQSQIYAVRYATGDTYDVPLVHAVDRIEALGSNAVAVGSDGKDLHFTSLRLGRFPVTVDRYTQPNAAQGETRSHGFFYKSDGEQSGLLGLPIVSENEPASRQLRRTSAALLYLRASGLRFSELGTLEAKAAAGDRNDGCRASCVDWYGNSRPLFLRGRVFALMGYELVEGAVSERRIVETRRVSFAPSPEHLTLR